MIVDCFIFNNEYNLLAARINYLQSVVDKFLVVESSYTFTGYKKPFRLKKHLAKNFASVAHKIIVLENDKYLSSKQLDDETKQILPYQASLSELQETLTKIDVDWKVWLNDCYQRELLAHLIDLYSNDSSFIIISDVDEIPSLNFINSIQLNKNILTFAQMEQYRYNIHFRDVAPWIGSLATRRSTVLAEGVNRLRFFTKRKLTHLSYQIQSNGGWHLTSLGSPDEIVYKMSSWGHQELNTPINRLMLKFRIQRGFDIFGREMEVTYEKTPNIPEEIRIPLSLIYMHPYKAYKPWDKALNYMACLTDKVYRSARSNFLQNYPFKR